MSYPRLHSELPGQTEATSDSMPDYRDYDAIATAIRNILHVAAVPVTIQANTNHTDFTHPLGVAPQFALPVGIGRIGEVWVDNTTLTDTGGTVYVADPPLNGTYTVMVLLYY